MNLLACPLSKTPVVQVEGGAFLSPSGFSFYEDDFRVPLAFASEWAQGQVEYERMNEAWLGAAEKSKASFASLDAEVTAIYTEIPLEGLVLDVAGHYGTLRRQAHIRVENYVSIDTMRVDLKQLAVTAPNFFAHYGLDAPAPYLQANAEFLPFLSSTFDVVHMRSCLDHFAAPQLALFEAYRVLVPGGRLVVGIALEGAYPLMDKHEKESESLAPRLARSFKNRVRRTDKIYSSLRRLKDRLGFGEHDNHSFHPTHESLIKLITSSGFRVSHEMWQAGYHRVLYVAAEKEKAVSISNLSQRDARA